MKLFSTEKKTASISLAMLPEAVPVPDHDGVARLYRLPGAQGNIGLISPLSSHFCGECNRLRLTADGHLKPCLHSREEICIKGLDEEGMDTIYSEVVPPEGLGLAVMNRLGRASAFRSIRA